MPGNAFLRFLKDAKAVPANGESLQKGYDSVNATTGWLEITDWSWDIESDTSFTKGTGAAVGKAKPNNFSFTHAFDASSPLLLTNIVKGTHFDAMEVHMLKQTGEDESKPLKPFWVLQASSVFVTKVSSKGSEDGSLTQDVELVFKQVKIDYKPQTNLGGLDDKGLTTFGWDIAAMNNAVPDTMPGAKGING